MLKHGLTPSGFVEIYLREKGIPTRDRASHELRHIAEVMEDARYRGEADGVIDMPDRWGFTACIGAAMFGRIDVLEMLMEHGAKLDLTTDAGETALHWGSLNGHTEVCALLLSAGADPNAQQVKGIQCRCLVKES